MLSPLAVMTKPAAIVSGGATDNSMDRDSLLTNSVSISAAAKANCGSASSYRISACVGTKLAREAKIANLTVLRNEIAGKEMGANDFAMAFNLLCCVEGGGSVCFLST